MSDEQKAGLAAAETASMSPGRQPKQEMKRAEAVSGVTRNSPPILHTAELVAESGARCAEWMNVDTFVVSAENCDHHISEKFLKDRSEFDKYRSIF